MRWAWWAWWAWWVACAVRAEHERTFEVTEGAAVGSLVGHIGDGLPDAGPPYTVVPVPGGAVDEDLRVDPATGEIRTRARLDRERRGAYSLVAIPASGRNVRVLVRVLDENDNAPTFPSARMSVRFSENTPRDVKRKLNPARDLDLGLFNTQRYDIVSGNSDDAFRLSSHRERDGVLYLDLQINGVLDRETIDSYSLVVEALDGGTPPLRGRMTVDIIIEDVNDNPPTFDRSIYSATVAENATVGTSVVRVFATDADAGENGEVEYSINRRQSDRAGAFRIDPVSGEIAVDKPLDFETEELHELVVVARDRGLQPLETTAFVSIRVTDVNDNRPTIGVIFLSDDATPKISEAARPGDFVARISVHDPDSKTEYSDVNVTMSGGDGRFGLTTRDKAVYLVIASLPLDRETRASYELTVVATDAGSPPLRASRLIELTVTDVNDNAPEFEQILYRGNVSERAEPGAAVARVWAHDRDSGDNAAVRYSLLTDAHAEWFAVDELSGSVTTRTRVDCETDAAPRLRVLARDLGRPSLSATATLVVTILDVNDNEPIFDQSFYNVSVPENEPVGRCILKVSATDPDCGVNAVVNYTLGEGFGKLSEFKLNSDTGELCIALELDYETRNIYEFPVIAMDRGSFATTAMIKIQLTDINDNHPVFYPREYNVSLREGNPSLTNEPILRVAATDSDSGRFGQLTYRISSGNDAGLFKIDRASGELSLARPTTLLARGQPVHRLNISAADGGGFRSMEDAEVFITIVDAAQSPPIFDSPQYQFMVSEDSKPGTLVGGVKATSIAGGHQQKVQYSIYSGDPDGYFTIDLNSGALRTNSFLDREVKASLLLNVQATSGNPPSYGHTQVNIAIGDVNDNTPEFESSTVRISVAESAAAGAAVYAAHARDADAGRNGTVAYRLAGGPRDLFAVHPTLGHVTLLKPLDYENVIRHWLVITATDGGTPPLSANLTLQVEVQDVNDNPPVFETKNNIEADVLESDPINTKILQVAALDRDTGNNARITYKLSTEAESEGSFGIEPSSGWIYVRRNLDRESRDSYRLKVTATDGGSPPAAATATVFIKILDANDNEPKFEKEAYRFVVEENRNGGARVGAMRATDVDLGNNAAIRYSLLPGNTSFHVDSATGIITTKAPLDREFRSQYDLVAEARDQGVPPRATRVPVHITVTDVNDNRPEMVDPREDVISVREEQPSGTEVARVRAIDKDNGYNATIKYSIDKGSSDIFSIDSMSGVIKTKKVLDHEESPIYDIWVTAVDSGIPSLNVTRRLRVDVLDINDNRPTFTSSSLVFKVREDAKIGHVVGAVACCDENSENNINNGSSRKLVTYTLISLTNDYVSGTFDIDRGTGSLVVARQLDRETQGEYSLEVRALDTSTMNNPQSSAVTVKVEITDVNDNAPKWPVDPITITIPEDTAPGSTIYNFTASDRDIGPNGDIRYKLLTGSTNNSNIFSVDPLTGTLSLMAHLDYESISEYMIIVKANDLALNVSERHDTSVTVHILILDSNDNSPFFVSSDNVVIVYNMNAPTSTSLYQAIAVDTDSGDNGRVTYKISAGNDNGYFAMNYDSGVISLVRPLDKVRKKLEHVLNITATDHGKPYTRKAYLTLNLTFHESTDVVPTFTQSLYKVNVSEDKRVGIFVTRISVKSHGHTGGTTIFSIPEGVAENKFAIDGQSGTITVKTALDREICDTYTFPVYLTDVSQRRSSMHFDMTTVMITVVDVNDNEPKFKPGSCYPLSIPENNKLDVIHTVVASDKDIGNNGAITYSITSGNMGNKFSIESTTGQLTARPLDRESQSRYRLVITARDHGSPVPLQSSCNITIMVQDKNDNAPKFDVSHYSAVIAEDVPIDTSVLKVRAFDPDLKLNAQIVYSLANESQWLFKIDNKTGIITTAGYFDRESQSKYSFMVVATDSGRFDARSQKVLVDITVSDVNDNKPIFTEYPFTGRVAVLSQLGFSVLKVSATDKDIDNNAEIVYSLADKASNEKFSINPTTGMLTTKQSLTSDNGKLFHLEILARDKGNPPQMATGLIEIRVGDIPYGTASLNFQKKSYTVNLEENAPAGKDIIQVTAVRSDGRRQRTFYSFGSGNEESAFRIDENSGLIKVANSDKLDYESYPGPKHRLVIVAKTDEYPPLYGYCEVVINLQDQNDNAPRFTQQQYTSNVHEGNAKRVFIMQLSAKDNDEGSNARVLYHIVDGNHDNAFIIEPAFSGSVKTNIVLDREIRETYKLTVIATDEGVPQLTGTATLRINVLDVNDNQPTFPPRSSITVSEGTEIGSILTSVTANDVDSDPPLTYDLESEVDTFAIDRYSGKIVLKSALDFETKQEYTLNVTASDSIYIAKTTLTIRVTDDNDNPPVFQKLSYYTVLSDGIGETELIAVNATDADSGENGNITYILLTADPGFRMDPASGLLYVNHSSLSGRRDVVLTVAAVDNGKPQNRAVTVIRVNSGATADMKPQIDKDNYRITIKENFLLGKMILQLARSYYQDNKTIVEFVISSGNEDIIFELTNDTLILIKTLDRERQDVYILHLSAVYDEKVHYVGSNTSLITIHVIVDDANDNAPVFKQMDDEYTISEKTSIGTVITKVTASDADLPGSLNSLIFYSITSGDDENFFMIDQHSGIIKVNNTLDYDNGRNQFSLVACACDQGEPSLCTLNNIQIALTDENDNDPTFPITEYFEFVGENEPSGTSIFTARATDADKGEFGKLNYSMVSTTSGGYLDRDESWKLFRIDFRTGQVNTNSVFDYEQRNRYAFTIQAADAGGKTATVRVRIEIESRDEFHPQFTQRTYRFTIPIPKSGGAIPAGYVLGHVVATDRDKGPDGRVVYQLSSKNDPHFKINRTTGAIMTKKKIDDISTLLEEKRDISLVVTASSGRQGSLSNKTAVEITAGSLIDNIPEPNLENETAPSKAPNGLADWALGLLIALILLIASFGGIFLFLHMKNRRNKKVNKPGLSSDGVGGSNSYVDPSAFDTIPIRGSTGVSGVAGQFAPPKYDEIPPYGPHTASSNSGAATTSELSGSEQSGSSGRGSAEEGEDGEDEEIRMINEGPLQRDSGIHRQTDDVDDDNLSDVSVHNTQEYLARLGIVDTATTGGASTSSRRCSESVGVGSTKDTLLHHGSVSIDPIHIFDEDAANENDITNLIYAKLNDVTGSDRASSADEVGAAVERAMVLGAFPAAPNDTTGAPTQGPSMTGSLSSIVHSEEELTGSYNWDYLLDWGPQYQPLAHVFSEIARLKDDAVSVQSANSGASSAKSKAASTSGTSKNAPPPLLTTVAPRSCPAPALTARQNQLLLPRSPISHDVAGGFSAATAMSPSFSPSLSPLATRSPSISPLVPPGLHHARTHKPHHSSHVQHPIQDTTLRI